MKMIFQKSLIVIALFVLPTSVFAQDANGLWQTQTNEQGHLEIEIEKCGAALCGTIVRARNPDGVSGPHEHLGKRMIWDMQPTDQAGSWANGKIWDPRNGRTFNSRMTLENGQLSVAGCVLGICQSQTWVRVR